MTPLERAVAAYQDGALDKSEAEAREAIAADGGDCEAWNLLGVVLRSTQRPVEAMECYRRALLLNPRHAGAWTNLGNAERDLKRAETAIACHDRALALQPHVAEFHHNRGIALMAANQFDAAIEAYSAALFLKPGVAQLAWDRALAYLGRGSLAEGWVDYEARLLTGELPQRDLPGKPWVGQAFADKTLLIISEQGFGDAIWVSRFLPQVRALGGKVILECRPELIGLFSEQGLADGYVKKGEPLPAADFHIYQCSLPGLFARDAQSIAAEPYFTPSVVDGRFDAAARAANGALKVGLVWSGSPTFKANKERALPLEQIVSAFSLPGVQLYSLQLGPARQELTSLKDAPVYDLAPLLRDFGDTAAVLGMLDLVIMTDSAVAHLGGALGRPVWVLLNRSPYWMWGSAGDDTPWYRSLRFFRCPSWDAWNAPLDQAAAALMQLIVC